MTKERKTQRRANQIIEDKVDRGLRDSVARVYELAGDAHINEDELVEVVIDANEWISFASGDDEGLYDFYKFKVFRFEDKIYLAQGLDIDVEAKGR